MTNADPRGFNDNYQTGIYRREIDMTKKHVNREVNGTAGTALNVLCSECGRDTKHDVLASVDITETFDDGPNFATYWSNHQVIQCCGCETISFRVRLRSDQNDPFDDDETITLFPSRSAGRSALRDVHLLPETVRRIYEETVKALNNEQPVLAGVGIRCLVESVCNDKKAEGKLFQQIDSLVDFGILTKDGAAILHRIRSLGNNAAHEVKPHTSEQLVAALEVCEHLLQGVYVLPHHAKSITPG